MPRPKQARVAALYQTAMSGIYFVGSYNGRGREECAIEALGKSLKTGKVIDVDELWEAKQEEESHA